MTHITEEALPGLVTWEEGRHRDGLVGKSRSKQASELPWGGQHPWNWPWLQSPATTHDAATITMATLSLRRIIPCIECLPCPPPLSHLILATALCVLYFRGTWSISIYKWGNSIREVKKHPWVHRTSKLQEQISHKLCLALFHLPKANHCQGSLLAQLSDWVELVS